MVETEAEITLVEIERKQREASPRVTPSTTPTSKGEGPISSKARLPELTIQSFDGTLTNWISFWDSYKAGIHSNPDLSEVAKFTYLQTLLEKSAKDAISGLSLTDAIMTKWLPYCKNDLATSNRYLVSTWNYC